MSKRGHGDRQRPGVEHSRGVFGDRAHATTADVAQVLRIVDRAEVTDWITGWRAEDRKAANRGPGGRPSMVDDRGVVALLLLLGLIGQPLTVRAMTALIVWGLDEDDRALLGIDLADLTAADLYHRLWRSLHRTLSVLDPHPVSKYRRLPLEEMAQLLSAIPAGVQETRRERLDKVSNRLLWATWMELPRDVRRRWKGNTVVDGTPVKAYSKRSSKLWAAADPSAGLYRMRGQHGLSDADLAKLPKVQRSRIGPWMWAHEATLLVAATNDPDREVTFPQMVVGVTLDKPAHSPGANAVRALRQMHENGLPAGYLVGDRAYGFAPALEHYAGPVRELGYRVLFDLTEAEVGRVRYVDGMVLLEGNLYCPTITRYPKLVNATRDHRLGDPDKGGEKISWDEFDKRIAERAKFLLQRNGLPRPDGSARVACPASGPRPTVQCPLRSDQDPAKTVTLWPVRKADLLPEDQRGGVCNNAGGNVTVQPDEVIPRYVQDMQFGTREWGAMFQTLRQTIESTNAQLKNAAKGDARASERRRVRGLAAATLFVTALAVALNLRKLAVFLDSPVLVDDRDRGRLRERGSARRADRTYRRGSRLYANARPSGAPPGEVA